MCLSLTLQHIAHTPATRHNQAMEHTEGTWVLAAAATCATGILLYVTYKGWFALSKKVL